MLVWPENARVANASLACGARGRQVGGEETIADQG
jgi:hypothetical protein